YHRWLGFVGHEYFHAFNAKRLRPIELGPFDYDNPPRTTSLWESEGFTEYYAALMLARSGLSTPDQFLGAIGSWIDQLQKSARRRQRSPGPIWTSGSGKRSLRPRSWTTAKRWTGLGWRSATARSRRIRTPRRRSAITWRRLSPERCGRRGPPSSRRPHGGRW